MLNFINYERKGILIHNYSLFCFLKFIDPLLIITLKTNIGHPLCPDLLQFFVLLKLTSAIPRTVQLSTIDLVSLSNYMHF